MENKLSPLTEFEVKFRIDGEKLFQWKDLVSSLDGLKEFIYAESDDIYYTRDLGANVDYEFIRYRFSTTTKERRAELTIKSKTHDNNNIKRSETNIRVDGNDKFFIESFVNGLGFTKNFRIRKPGVHIYRFKDATLPFYTVMDENDKVEHFIEIEVNEDIIHNLTEKDAWDIIRKYEEILKPLGITAQNRLRLSLFEMYANRR